MESYNLINSRCYTLPCHLLSKLYSYIHRVTEPYCTTCNNQNLFVWKYESNQMEIIVETREYFVDENQHLKLFGFQ